MRLALVTETYPPEINGVAMTLSQLVHGLRSRNHSVQVVRPSQTTETETEQTDPDLLRVPGIPIPRYPDLRFGIPCRSRLIHAWRTNPPDIVHVATEGPLGLSAIRAAKRLNIPVTSTFHTNFHSYSEHYNARFLTRTVLAVLRWVHNQTACTMAPTAELAQELADEGFKNMDVFGRGVRLDVFNPQARDESLRRSWGAAPEDPVFIHVSRLAAEKNYDLLSRCFRRIQKTVPNAKFVIVGGGPIMDEIREEFPYATITGPIVLENREELARHYASADVFLYPSLTETYGNVTTESMACGNTVVAYNYAAAALHIDHGVNGLLVPLHDESAFLDTALSVALDPDLRQQLGNAASQYAPAFDWSPVINTFESILLREIKRHAYPKSNDFHAAPQEAKV